MAKKINVVTSPLATPEMLAMLNDIIKACGANSVDCERCEKCQLNVDAAKLDVADTYNIAVAIKAQFFPEEA